MYTLKNIAQRGSMLGAAVALLVAAMVPAGTALADALNPLTERSLMLSSSAPGFQDSDGSGNSAGTPNVIGENYAPAGSGPNGKKTGEKFTFKTSSSATIKAFTLQYCTKAAGMCAAPGNNTGDDHTSNRVANGNVSGSWNDSKSDFEVKTGFTEASGAIAGGQFQVTVDPDGSGPTAAAAVTGWSFSTENAEDSTAPTTGKNNYVTLTNSTGEAIPSGAVVTIEFKASETVFITNPGDDAFFVKLNTYNTVGADLSEYAPASTTNVVDGGVTVANVMTDSIHITTKVLETMSFSVGTRNRDTVVLNCAGYPSQATIDAGCEGATGANIAHGKCDPITQVNGNRLQLGDSTAEYSLDTRQAYDVYSYWRLSSNSSGGATVYYSGNTLQNTVGDFIDDMQTKAASQPGTNQFGLGFVDSTETNAADYTGSASDSAPFQTVTGQTGTGDNGAAYTALQTASLNYADATGTIDDGNAGPGTAQFMFKKTSLTVPEVIAQENTDVISCSTAKMRYVANIGADTPAGIYTTKINYLAAPQY